MSYDLIQMFNDMSNKILTAAGLLLVSVACSTQADEPLQYGRLSVALSGEPAVEVVSKTPETLEQTDPEAAGYMVRLYNSSDEKLYEAAFSEFQTQTLPLATYYVTAENCTEAAAEEGTGKMRLYGRSNDVTLSADNLEQTATANCTVSNAKVSVQFDASVQNRFSGLQVTLSGGTTRTAPITVAQTAAGVVTETWFNPSELTYTISGTFTGSGMNKPVEITKSLTLEAKNNILLLVKVNLENGQLTPSVTIDVELDGVNEVPEEFNPYI